MTLGRARPERLASGQAFIGRGGMFVSRWRRCNGTDQLVDVATVFEIAAATRFGRSGATSAC